MKKYVNPMLQVVSIKNNDIVTSSHGYGGSTEAVSGNLAPGQRGMDDWDAGY